MRMTFQHLLSMVLITSRCSQNSILDANGNTSSMQLEIHPRCNWKDIGDVIITLLIQFDKNNSSCTVENCLQQEMLGGQVSITCPIRGLPLGGQVSTTCPIRRLSLGGQVSTTCPIRRDAFSLTEHSC